MPKKKKKLLEIWVNYKPINYVLFTWGLRIIHQSISIVKRKRQKKKKKSYIVHVLFLK